MIAASLFALGLAVTQADPEVMGHVYVRHPDGGVRTHFEFLSRTGITELNSQREYDPHWLGRDWFLNVRHEDDGIRLLYWAGKAGEQLPLDLSKRLRQGEPTPEIAGPSVERLYQDLVFTDTIELGTFGNGAQLMLSLSAKPPDPRPEPLDLTEDTMRLSGLCLQGSVAIVNRHYVIAHLDGFGDYLQFRSPELGRITMSLTPLDSSTIIGSYDAGQIRIEHPAGHEILITGVGVGPGGLMPPGPFNVHGSIENEAFDRGSLDRYQMETADEMFEGSIRDNVQAAIRNTPFASVGATIGSRERASPQLGNFMGKWGSRLRDCGAERAPPGG